MADDGLENRLFSHSAYFNSLVELVPAKYYLPDDEVEKFNKFHQNRKQKAPKQAIKEASKRAKRLRLDPGQHKTVLELQVESERKEREESSEGEEEVASDRFSSLSSEICDVNSNDLRSSLHSKIEQLRLKRKASNKKGVDRPKKKTKLEVKDKKKKDGANSSVRDSKHFQSEDRKVLNDKGEVVFSKFDFISQHQGKGVHSTNKTQNYKKLLAQAEARKSKLNKMKEIDAQKANEVQKKQTWKTALLKAGGEKPKTDPKLLKKAIKRREKKKGKSKQQWKEREDHIKRQKDEKQKTRKQHIKERIESKKGKKSKGNKKGHKPGF